MQLIAVTKEVEVARVDKECQQLVAATDQRERPVFIKLERRGSGTQGGTSRRDIWQYLVRHTRNTKVLA